MASFGEMLCELRKDKHLTQKELGDLLSLSTGTISNYETGRHFPDLDGLKDIASFFSVSVDYLIGAAPESITTNEMNRYIAEDMTVGKLISIISSLSPHNQKLVCEVVRLAQAGDKNS